MVTNLPMKTRTKPLVTDMEGDIQQTTLPIDANDEDERHQSSKSSWEMKGSAHAPCTWTPFISYEFFMWSCHILLSILACLDRFYWNVWPRQTYQIGNGSAGNDRVELLQGPWSVKFFDIIARVSGRFSILTLNLLFFVRIKTIENWLVTSWVNKFILDCSNIVRANLRLHIWNGVVFCVLLLLHVWSILLPCLFHRYDIQVIPGYFEYPLSERTPPGFKDADSEAKMMSMQVDDVFRMVEMTFTLGVMIPLSYYWFSRRYHIAIHIHRVAAIIVFIDIVRRHSHPHSIIINTPVFFIWLVERVFMAQEQTMSMQFYRIKLGEDYMVIFWDSFTKCKSIGCNYFIKLVESSLVEPAHAFTTFQNRDNLHIEGLNSDWSTGVVMRVYHNKRRPALSRTDNTSHTGRLYRCKVESSRIEVRGPFTGEMSELINKAQNPGGFSLFRNICLRKNKQVNTEQVTLAGSVVLIGTGSGVNYLLDAVQCYSPDKGRLLVLWTTRDTTLFNWVSSLMYQIVPSEQQQLRIVLANTDMSNMNKVNFPLVLSDVTSRDFTDPPCIEHVNRRIDFQREIPAKSHVFFQGSSRVGKAVSAACLSNGCWLHRGTGGKEVDNVSRRPPTIIQNPSVSPDVSRDIQLDRIAYE